MPMTLFLLMASLTGCTPVVDGAPPSDSGMNGGGAPPDGWATRLRLDIDGVQKDWDLGPRHLPEPFFALPVLPDPGATCTPTTFISMAPSKLGAEAPHLFLFAYDLGPTTVTALPEAPFHRASQPFVTGASWPGEDPGTAVVISGGTLRSDVDEKQALFEINGGRLCFEREPLDDVNNNIHHADCEPFLQATFLFDGHLEPASEPVEGIGITVLPTGEQLCTPTGL